MDIGNSLTLETAKDTRSRERPCQTKVQFYLNITPSAHTGYSSSTSLFPTDQILPNSPFDTTILQWVRRQWKTQSVPPCCNHLHIIPQKYKPTSKLCIAFRTHYTVHHFGSDLLLFSAFPEWMCHQSRFLQMSVFCQYPSDSHGGSGKV